MANDNLAPIVAQILSDDYAINMACNSQIIADDPGNAPQDAMLGGANQTAIWVRRPSKTDRPFLGAMDYEYDLIVQVDVASRASNQAAFDVADMVEALLKTTTSKFFNNAIVPLDLLLQSRTAMFDDVLGAWVEMVRFRAQGVYR